MSKFPYPYRRAGTKCFAMLCSNKGTALIEMAVALPVLLSFITGIIAYGSWFLTAHHIQQTANDAARAALAGLSAAERVELAETRVDTDLRRVGQFDPANVTVLVSEDGDSLVVRLSYDATDDPMLALSLIPVPSTTIERSAAIQLPHY